MAVLKTDPIRSESIEGLLPVRTKAQRELWRRTRSTLCLLAIIGSFVAAPVAHSQSPQPTEYELKAAFLFNFAKFIDWPGKSFGGTNSAFTVCVIGPDPFGKILDTYFSGKTIAGHVAEVDRFPSPAEALGKRCQIAFISPSERPHFREVIASFRGQSTLLVGDADGFAESGGAIEFLLENEHVRFAINPEAADRADLKVSSKLLALAEIVHDDSEKRRN
jgi:YfiR/HmsC-like